MRVADGTEEMISIRMHRRPDGTSGFEAVYTKGPEVIVMKRLGVNEVRDVVRSLITTLTSMEVEGGHETTYPVIGPGEASDGLGRLPDGSSAGVGDAELC